MLLALRSALQSRVRADLSSSSSDFSVSRAFRARARAAPRSAPVGSSTPPLFAWVGRETAGLFRCSVSTRSSSVSLSVLLGVRNVSAALPEMGRVPVWSPFHAAWVMGVSTRAAGWTALFSV